jgi:hypothetical protein
MKTIKLMPLALAMSVSLNSFASTSNTEESLSYVTPLSTESVENREIKDEKADVLPEDDKILWNSLDYTFAGIGGFIGAVVGIPSGLVVGAVSVAFAGGIAGGIAGMAPEQLKKFGETVAPVIGGIPGAIAGGYYGINYGWQVGIRISKKILPDNNSRLPDNNNYISEQAL